jgi:hypothetical protein
MPKDIAGDPHLDAKLHALVRGLGGYLGRLRLQKYFHDDPRAYVMSREDYARIFGSEDGYGEFVREARVRAFIQSLPQLPGWLERTDTDVECARIARKNGRLR